MTEEKELSNEEFAFEFFASIDEFYQEWKENNSATLPDWEIAIKRAKKEGVLSIDKKRSKLRKKILILAPYVRKRDFSYKKDVLPHTRKSNGPYKYSQNLFTFLKFKPSTTIVTASYQAPWHIKHEGGSNWTVQCLHPAHDHVTIEGLTKCSVLLCASNYTKEHIFK